MFVMRDLVAAADLALRAAKSQGGNTIVGSPVEVAPGITVLGAAETRPDVTLVLMHEGPGFPGPLPCVRAALAARE